VFTSKAALAVFLQLSLIAVPVFADQIFLKNGDRISGKILKKEKDKISIKTDAAGTLEIKWEAVEKITADGDLVFEMTDGAKVKGSVVHSNGEFSVETDEGKSVAIDQGNLAAIRNPELQDKYEAEAAEKANRSIFKHWSGSADVGFSLTAGNSDTRSLNFGARGVRETVDDKLTLFAKGVQSSNSTTGVRVTTAEALWFGGRYDRNFDGKMFVFGTGNLEYDRPQHLNLRIVAGGGFGYKWIRTDRTKFNLIGGATLNREYFEDADNRTSAESLVGEEFMFKFTDRTRVEQRFEVYPSLSRAGTFRANLDASFVTALNSWLGWHVSLGDRFNSDPVPGARSNDLLFSTGFRATFGKKK